MFARFLAWILNFLQKTLALDIPRIDIASSVTFSGRCQNMTLVALEVLKSSRAAQYVRMSTDKQQYSPLNQMAAIAAYAARRNLTIVRTYTDVPFQLEVRRHSQIGIGSGPQSGILGEPGNRKSCPVNCTHNFDDRLSGRRQVDAGGTAALDPAAAVAFRTARH
jgi:hypothetical protein